MELRPGLFRNLLGAALLGLGGLGSAASAQSQPPDAGAPAPPAAAAPTSPPASAPPPAATPPIASPGSAPPAPPSVDLGAAKKQAAKDAAEGQKLLKKRSFAEAIPKLESSYVADPKPATLRALAEAQAGDSQPVAAYRSYETLLQRHASELKPKERTAVDQALGDLARATGTIRLTISVPDARINIDGHDVAAGDAAQPIRVLPGRHSIAIAKPDFDLYTAGVEVEGGKEAAVDAKLKAEVKTGHVRVTAPAVLEGSVLVDGKAVGRLPWEGDLPPGPHVFDVTGPGLPSDPKTVDVAAKSELVVELPTQPLPPLVAVTPAAPGLAGPEPLAAPDALTTAEPTATLAAPATAPAAREPEGVRIGLLLGVLALPRPVQAELVAKLGPYLAIGGQYSMLPDLTPPGFDAELKLSAIQGVARIFPFGGVFYIGSGFGYQQVRAALGSTDSSSGDRIEVSCDMSGFIVSPQIGLLWVLSSGFSFGINVGLQIPLPKEPVVEATYNGQPVPAQASGAVPQEAVDRANGMKLTVGDVARLVSKYPFPNIDLLKIGFFF